ncbi:hypothetical protein H257_13860 [Aphanomyces astaci]|uniref:Major facilitator superfamily (MFS) profile domain-containing protein n=1 Tax=Aphanomyces astaci TaxID=112090 RepID=W4FTJ1_APHAT|nr:hypothetical protein H257_13860 [Aphanomyces astaci]ETV70777.1 hypothetical protein H257_13860 [Aphanomyces astaci]RHY31474.1 hypothetical protein DYB25_008096 [Aphanomyces astaci]RHY35817.1 hypothetical protein DYB38_009112 [Aphanomyces astaci]RHY43350.1 hypothetical protein DYB34_011727 [Aphanomyces astaci]RQM20534.1 hypothetical protein B5M09_009226 [Aphanomyces astaci]|eukprot:XP_009839841.1 hypothetical protein H257_13860 [Aphanomyces astaci]
MADVRSITQRLDSLPLTGFLSISVHYWGLLFKAGLGWAFDAMDVFLFTYLGAATGGNGGWIKELQPTAHEKGLLGSASFAGSLFGSLIFGQLADVYGRKNMFAVTLLIFMAGTLLCGTANDVGTMLAFRFIAGFGLGGELPVASALVQELVPTAVRGRIIVILESFWSVGCMIAVLMGFELVKHVSWRTVFYLSCIPAVWAIVIRLWVPESPKWLASVGRTAEADAIVTKIEASHGVVSKSDGDKADVAATSGDDAGWSALNPLDRLCILFRGEFLVRTIVLWTVWIGIAFSYYAIYVWLPVLRSKEKGGYNISGSTWEIFFIVFWQFPGYLSAAYLVEIIGRKITLVAYLFGSFVSALAFGYVENNQVNLLVTGAFMSWFMLGAWGALYAYTPENYPTAIRATGCSYPNGFSRIGAIAGPYVMPLMLDAKWSSTTIMWVAGGAPMIFVALVLLAFGFETRGQDVEVCPRIEAYLKAKAGIAVPSKDTVATPGPDNFEMK